MKIITDISQNSEEWLAYRRGKLTGSKASLVTPKKRGSGQRAEYWELLAEQFITDDVEDVSSKADERGHQLEQDCIDITAAKLGLTNIVTGAIWESSNGIAISPDAYVDADPITVAIECKCLNAANHFKAWHEATYSEGGKGVLHVIPEAYRTQAVHYFITNTNLDTLYFAFYNPQFAIKATRIAHFIITIQRSWIKEEIQELLDLELTTMAQIQEEVKKINEYLKPALCKSIGLVLFTLVSSPIS